MSYKETLKHCVRQLNEYDSQPHNEEVVRIQNEVDEIYLKASLFDELIDLHKRDLPTELKRELIENYIIIYITNKNFFRRDNIETNY